MGAHVVAYSFPHSWRTRKDGPGGVLGLAEGLAWVVALAGAAVLVLQVSDYGYVPNAVPAADAPCFAPAPPP